MALTNAQHQANWRKRHNAKLKIREKEFKRLRAENARLKKQLGAVQLRKEHQHEQPSC